jgi:hypothetical protein
MKKKRMPLGQLLVLVLAALLFSAASRVDAPWIEARSAHYTIFYQAGFEKDESGEYVRGGAGERNKTIFPSRALRAISEVAGPEITLTRSSRLSPSDQRALIRGHASV